MDWLPEIHLIYTCLFSLENILTPLHVSGILSEAIEVMVKRKVMAHILTEFAFLLGRKTTQ